MRKRLHFLLSLLATSTILSGCKFLDAGAFRVIGINSLSDEEKKKDVEYTITFDTNGGSPIDSIKVKHNRLAHLENVAIPTKEGHDFLGWYADKKLTQKYDDKTQVTSDFTLYAYWTWDVKTPKFMMGKYPQRLIRDRTLIQTLDRLSENQNTQDFYDISYDGAKYRKAKARAEYDQIIPGNYYYFEYDYVYWDVVKNTENSYVNTIRLTSHYVLDNRPFNNTGYESFDNSSLKNEIADFSSNNLNNCEQAGLLKDMEIIRNSYYIKDEKYEATEYAKIMGFSSKIWQEYGANSSKVAIDNNTHEQIPTDATEYCGVIPLIMEFDPSEKQYHTVTFNTNGGHPIEPIRYYYGEIQRSYELPKNVVKDTVFDGDESIKYEFLGWLDYPAQQNVDDYATWYRTNWGDLTLRAAFRETRQIHYSQITYRLPSGAYNNSNNPSQVRISSVVTLSDPYFEHHNFLGWYLEVTYKNKIEVLENIRSDLTIYAKFEIASYPITYHLDDDATNDDRNPTSFTYTIEDDIRQFYPPSSQHRNFIGWARSADLTDRLDNDRLNLKNQTYIHLYPIWETKTYKFTFHIDKSSGEKFVNSTEDLTYNKTHFQWYEDLSGNYYFNLYYEAKYKVYGDLYLPRAYKSHYRFNGYKVNGVLVNENTPIDFVNRDLIADFTYVEAGVDFVYSLPSGVYFDELAPKIEHFDEGVTGTLNFPIDPVGHQIRAYYCRGESTTNNYFDSSTVLPVGDDGKVDPITYYIYFESKHESEYDHYSSHCLYCDAEFDAPDYSGTFTVGNTIEFGFYPWSGVSKSLPEGIELPTIEDPKGWTLDLTHGGHSNSKYAHFDLHQVEYSRIYKYRFLYLFDKEQVVCWKYMPLKWHVMQADTVNGIYNLQCEFYIDSIILSAEKEIFSTVDEVNNENYSYKTSFAREYINTDLFNLIFDNYEQD